MISKSSYVKYWECPKKIWLNYYKKDEAEYSEMLQEAAIDGNKVGDLAKAYFDGTKDVSMRKSDGSIDYDNQCAATLEALQDNVNCIAEASFRYKDLFCAVDLLKKDDKGYSIYEIKSSLDIEKKQLVDVSFQKYVLEKLGYKINNIYVMHPNREYFLHGKLDVKSYFKPECVDNNKIVLKNLNNISSNISEISNILKNKEPETVFCGHCKKCEFSKYCKRDLPEDNIEMINGFKYSHKFYNEKIYTVKDYVNSENYKCKPYKKDSLQDIQLNSIISGNTQPIIDKQKINAFVSNIKYPIYYLDFESTKEIIPKIDGFRPYEEYPFQYSLHIEYKDGKIEHKEFLGDEINCGRAVALHLIQDIPQGSQIMAYNDDMEKRMITYLANKYSDLKDSLLPLLNNFVDLLNVFTSGAYFDPKQGNSCSIKATMPALCPHMQEAYKNLPVVHSGGEALTMFPKLIEMKDLDKQKYVETRKGMLEYCKLDTLSMVEIVKVLKNI